MLQSTSGKGLLKVAYEDASTVQSSSVAQYKSLQAEIQQLQSARSDLETCEKEIQKARAGVEHYQKQIKVLKEKEMKLSERHERNENKPTLFGHSGLGLLFANEKKNQKLKEDLDKLRGQLEDANKKQAQWNRRLNSNKSAVSILAEKAQRKDHLETQIERLEERLISTQPEFSEITGIRADKAELVSLQTQMKAILVACQKALQGYRQALQLTKRAKRSNLASAVNERNERLWQIQRNNMMRESTLPAENASKSLIETFEKIPKSVRARYPELMKNVGNIPLARLKVGNFGRDVLAGAALGNFGDAMNKINHARKISENENEINSCMLIVKNQISLIETVVAHLEKDVIRRASQIKTLSQSALERALSSESNVMEPSSISLEKTAPIKYDAPVLEVRNVPNLLGSHAANGIGQDSLAVPNDANSSHQNIVVPEALSQPKLLKLLKDHHVDENSPQYASFNIISLDAGDIVELLQGDLSNGLGGVFKDYILVSHKGKVGKISRKIVAEA